MSWEALCAEVVEANQRIERAGLPRMSHATARHEVRGRSRSSTQ